jgi:Helicase associated domain
MVPPEEDDWQQQQQQQHDKDTTTVSFANNYDALVKFHRRHGHCWVPPQHELFPWVTHLYRLRCWNHHPPPSSQQQEVARLLRAIGFYTINDHVARQKEAEQDQVWFFQYQQHMVADDHGEETHVARQKEAKQKSSLVFSASASAAYGGGRSW